MRGAADGRAPRPRRRRSAANFARALANEPGNVLTPRELASRASRAGTSGGLAVDVLDETPACASSACACCSASRRAAPSRRASSCCATMPPGAPASPVLGLVGKGITFDTGRHLDQAGRRHGAHEGRHVGRRGGGGRDRAPRALGAPVRVIGVIPRCENMPGGRAIRPGDVIDRRERQDGRDRQHRRRGPAGARRRALVRAAAGRHAYRGRRDADRRRGRGARASRRGPVRASGRLGRCGADRRRARRRARLAMPMYEEYGEQLQSEIADVANVGGPLGRSVTAAAFLGVRRGGAPWAHLDIAGTAWAEERKPYQPKGADRRGRAHAHRTGAGTSRTSGAGLQAGACRSV